MTKTRLAPSSVPPLEEAELNDLATYLKQRPDGKWEETRYHFGPGDRVLITSGPHEGEEAVIDTVAGVTRGDDGTWNGDVGYNALLQDGRSVTVQWDRVEKVA